jgi:hypothetical protein
LNIKKLIISELGIIDLTDESYEHSSRMKHSGQWPKHNNWSWFAELTEYISSKEQRRIFLTSQDDEIRRAILREGMILERGYNRRLSGKYGDRLRSYYLIHEIGKDVMVSVHDTAKRAFTARANGLKDTNDMGQPVYFDGKSLEGTL